MLPKESAKLYKDELDEHNPFRACVAVVNRNHHDSITLCEEDDVSKKLLEKKILLDSSLSASTKKKALAHVGTQSLIAAVDSMYNNFICKRWIPITVAKLDSLIKGNEEAEKNTLGIPH